MDWTCADADDANQIDIENFMRGKKPKTFQEATAISFESISQISSSIDPKNNDWIRKVSKWSVTSSKNLNFFPNEFNIKEVILLFKYLKLNLGRKI